ncbi:RNase E specificity factor CsrD [Vibrio sp. S4M6]|uniref:RNase E specificity factor CsrD n=1 Tax=Vibrio sinus TaxID=2946865 RepID=UPI002029FF37|nr:RNase E specificity factor CsrD [Vibrio sinus]MCL9780520.1 RNase E specificity factor CsrD [Vibrio sinus]
MRRTPTLKLSARLVAFVTIIVVSAMFIIFIGGSLSFKRIGQEYQNHYLYGIVEVVDKELQQPNSVKSFRTWMPKLLHAADVVDMSLSNNQGVVYQFVNKSSHTNPAFLYEKSYQLTLNPSYKMSFKAIPPYLGYGYSIGALSSITIAVALVLFCLVRGVRWLKSQLYGCELLEERGRMILAGRVEEYAKGDFREWPFTASEALDTLIEELQDARQERSRFDTFIRSQTFLDQLTGTANRVLFDSKLESALSEGGAHGGVMLVRVEDIEQVREENSKRTADEFIVEIGERISNIVQRYPDIILSRYYSSDFAIFAPQLTSKDISYIVQSCLKQLQSISPPSPLDKDNWIHIGMTMYQEGEHQAAIMDEVESALRNAQVQQINTWNRYDKPARFDHERGNVRWRSLFDQSIAPNELYLFEQACFMHNAQHEMMAIHNELFVRINDPERGVLKASKYNAALEAVGYESRLDKAALHIIFQYIKASYSPLKLYSINMHVTPFADKSHFKWFRDELLQLPSMYRKRLTFEFAEARLVEHLDYMRPVIKMLSGFGFRVCVDQAGRSVVSTHYLKDLNIDYLKLHRSLVKQIDQRHENRLFVRSLVGACASIETKVIAVGVDSKQERNTLKELGVNGMQGRYLQPEKQVYPTEKKLKTQPIPSMVKIGRRNRWRKK